MGAPMNTFSDRYGELRDTLRQQAMAQRIPLEGGIELTNRCNLRCVHCYRPSEHRADLPKQWIYDLVDDLVAEGCLFLTLTGGEPTLRKDLLDIHGYIRRKGVLTLLFTNGTLIDERLVNGLLEHPPVVVEVSLYGTSRDTYRAVTGDPDGFDKAIRGVRLLQEAGLSVHLKSVFMRANQHDASSFLALADSLGVSSHFETNINPAVDGGLDPVKQRLSAEEALQVDLLDPYRADAWTRSLSAMASTPSASPRRGPCNAGANVFLVDSSGHLNPCVLWRSSPIPLDSTGFSEAWHGPMARISRDRLSIPPRCDSCDQSQECVICPAWSFLEHGDRDAALGFMCRIAEVRTKLRQSTIHDAQTAINGTMSDNQGDRHGSQGRAGEQRTAGGSDSGGPGQGESLGAHGPGSAQSRRVLLRQGGSLLPDRGRGAAVAQPRIRFERSEGFVLREVAGCCLLVPTGGTKGPFLNLIKLGGLAAEVWRSLVSGPASAEDLISGRDGPVDEAHEIAPILQALSAAGALTPLPPRRSE